MMISSALPMKSISMLEYIIIKKYHGTLAPALEWTTLLQLDHFDDIAIVSSWLAGNFSSCCELRNIKDW